MMLNIDSESISRNDSHFFGNINFRFDDFYFPSNDWNDFIFVILNWWIQSLRNLLSNDVVKEELLFMDGPFLVKINYLKDDIFTLFFVKNDHDIINSFEINKELFVRDFLIEVNSLIREFDKTKMKSKDFDELKKNYSKLQLLMNNKINDRFSN